jgi:hypothetical protein
MQSFQILTIGSNYAELTLQISNQNRSINPLEPAIRMPVKTAYLFFGF